MPLVANEGAGGYSEGKGVWESTFVMLKPELHISQKGGQFATPIFMLGEETVQLYLSLDERLAMFVWQLTGVMASPEVRVNPTALFLFAQQELAKATNKTMYLRTDNNGYAKGLVVQPEQRYVCRYAGMTSRNDTGLADEVDGTGLNVGAKYIMYSAIVQEGPYTGWSIPHRIKASYSWVRGAKGGWDINVSPKTVLYQALTSMGLTAERFEDVEFTDRDNPWPTLDAKLLSLSAQSPFSTFVNEGGYAEVYEKMKPVPLAKCPKVVEDPLTGGKVTPASGGLTTDEEQLLELLGIAGELVGVTGPLVAPGTLKLMPDGITVLKNIFKPLCQATEALRTGALDVRGGGVWPPSKWGVPTMTDALNVLLAFTLDMNEAQTALTAGPEAMVALVQVRLDDVHTATDDEAIPF